MDELFTEPHSELADVSPRLLNGELSQLQFFRRVLDEACDPTNPLLERVRFLAILGAHLDEFFMVRVARLKQRQGAMRSNDVPEEVTLEDRLAIRSTTLTLMQLARACWRNDIQPELSQAGLHICHYADLTRAQQQSVRRYFESRVFPILTPLAVDPGRPFPFISNLSLNLAIMTRQANHRERFARVKVPNVLPRFVPLSKARSSSKALQPETYVWLEEVVAAHIEVLFPCVQVLSAYPFRVTRSADIAVEEMGTEDVLETMAEEVRQRRFGPPVRLTIGHDMPSQTLDLLSKYLESDPQDIYAVNGPLGLKDLQVLYQLDRPKLKERPFRAITPANLKPHRKTDQFFAAIRRADILLHHPFDSFAPVVDFLQRAARDPNVLTIKQTLYRVGPDSPVIQALLEAIRNDKQVAVLVELKARFDEASNINWARQLESQGIHVSYGPVGLKTRAKATLVVRREGQGLRRYVHLATGNYNPDTAQHYTDLGLFTARPQIGTEVADLFNYLTGYSTTQACEQLLVAPLNLRQRLEALIQREIDHSQSGQPGHLIWKMNALTDPAIIQLLYSAAQAGVKIDLIIRGMCTLQPGLPRLSENIHVRSITGRFLEHSRIYYFHNSGQPEVYLGSTDLVARHLNQQIEILFPILDKRWIHHLRREVLDIYLADTVKAHWLQPDGTYARVSTRADEPVINAQLFQIQHRLRRSARKGDPR